MNNRYPQVLPGMSFTKADLTLDGLVKTLNPLGFREAIIHTNGDCLCEHCGHPYRLHPMCDRIKSAENEPFLHVACDGRRLKL